METDTNTFTIYIFRRLIKNAELTKNFQENSIRSWRMRKTTDTQYTISQRQKHDTLTPLLFVNCFLLCYATTCFRSARYHKLFLKLRFVASCVLASSGGNVGFLVCFESLLRIGYERALVGDYFTTKYHCEWKLCSLYSESLDQAKTFSVEVAWLMQNSFILCEIAYLFFRMFL